MVTRVQLFRNPGLSWFEGPLGLVLVGSELKDATENEERVALIPEAAFDRVARDVAGGDGEVAGGGDGTRPGAGAPEFAFRDGERELACEVAERIRELSARAHVEDEVDVVGHDRERAKSYAEPVLRVPKDGSYSCVLAPEQGLSRFQHDVIRSPQRDRAGDFSLRVFFLGDEFELLHRAK